MSPAAGEFPDSQLRRRHLLIATAIGTVSAMLCAWFHPTLDGALADLGWSFNAARDLMASRDPYRHVVSYVMVPYPLTAAILVFPLAMIPGNVGLIAGFGAAAGLLAYGLIRDREYWRLIVFVSPPFLMAVRFMQWSPLFMAIFYYPLLAPFLLAKPTLGAPVAASIDWNAERAARAGIGMGAVIGISLVLMPDWPWRWFAQLQVYSGFVPLYTWAGLLFVFSLVFWRNWRARLFFLLTITPQHRFFYDQILLWMIPTTARQMILLTCGSWIAFAAVRMIYTVLWPSPPFILGLMYCPAFLIVLSQQGVLSRVSESVRVNRRRPQDRLF